MLSFSTRFDIDMKPTDGMTLLGVLLSPIVTRSHDFNHPHLIFCLPGLFAPFFTPSPAPVFGAILLGLYGC